MLVVYEVFGPSDRARTCNHRITRSLLNPIERFTFIEWLPSCTIGIGQIAICLPMLGPSIVRHLRRGFMRIRDSKNGNQEPAPQCSGELGPIPNGAMKGQENTLGSVNTQNLEAYAMGRIHTDQERFTIVSSISKDMSIETRATQLSY